MLFLVYESGYFSRVFRIERGMLFISIGWPVQSLRSDIYQQFPRSFCIIYPFRELMGRLSQYLNHATMVLFTSNLTKEKSRFIFPESVGTSQEL